MSEATDRTSDASSRRFRPYPDYRESGVEWLGGIPAHWEPARLWRLCSATSGATPTKENPAYWNGEVPWVSPKDMKRRVISTSEDLITQQALDETGIKFITPQVVLVVVRGMILAHSFPVAVTAAPVTINQDMKALRLIDGVDAFYFAWALDGLARGIIATVVEEAAHGTRAIRMDQWRSLVVPLPPCPEQQAITAFLDRETAKIDALVARKERLIELLQEKRTALITRAVTRGLDPNVPMKDSGVEWLGEIPAHWELKQWRYCCRVTEGQVAPDDEQFRERPLIAPNHIESGTGRILHMESAAEQGAISGKYLVKPGDIIYSKIRPALNKVCIAVGDWLCSADMYPVSITEMHLQTRFLLYFMLSRPFVQLMVDESMRVAMPKVNRDKLAACPLLVPDPTEQLALADSLDRETARIDALSAKVQEAIDHLKEFRTALISAAVTGKIDVREAVPR